jgi:hexosaminidase
MTNHPFMTKYCILLFTLYCSVAFSQSVLPLIPQPTSVQQSEGHFELTPTTIIQGDEKLFETLYLQKAIQLATGWELKVLPVAGNVPKISLSHSLKAIASKEGYALSITPQTIAIQADQDAGVFHGIQTVLQLVPASHGTKITIPCVQITDEPKYAWRGMHLDCARHFFPVDFIKKYIDALALYKMNTFHWHLTDDQGWRIQIKQYPKLTEVGAWRNGSMVGHYREQVYDTIRYGGFYTQEEIKSVIDYAAKRHITIIPEIEMPGHAVAALAAYPQYSCTGGPFEVAKKWGVLDDVFCPKAETITFLENILDEVIALFPSTYIHIGGDECPKTRWKKCPRCQALIKEKGLKDEHELQSYFVQTIEKYVNSKGRKIIGWDEILEGGLAPNAAVMSWRGTEGGIAAAQQHHEVVMSPGSHCYFDHYQGDPKNEPLAIGGYTPVEKVYSFNPTPAKLTPEEATYILGGQANVWTEYINTPAQVEYMVFPRMMALSEVLWGTANPANYADFQNRLLQQLPSLDQKAIIYSKAIFEITSSVEPNPNGKGLWATLKSAQDQKGIRYTLDGTQPTWKSSSYTGPIAISESLTLKAAYFEKEVQKGNPIELPLSLNKATAKKIVLLNNPHDNYKSGGSFALINGIKGNQQKFGRDWLGFSGKDANATIDLGTPLPISNVTIGVLSNEASWIYYPSQIEVFVSQDGQTFTSVGKASIDQIEAQKGNVIIDFPTTTALYIKVVATNIGLIKDGNPGSGSPAWLFVDEIGAN